MSEELFDHFDSEKAAEYPTSGTKLLIFIFQLIEKSFLPECYQISDWESMGFTELKKYQGLAVSSY